MNKLTDLWKNIPDWLLLLIVMVVICLLSGSPLMIFIMAMCFVLFCIGKLYIHRMSGDQMKGDNPTPSEGVQTSDSTITNKPVPMMGSDNNGFAVPEPEVVMDVSDFDMEPVEVPKEEAFTPMPESEKHEETDDSSDIEEGSDGMLDFTDEDWDAFFEDL